VIRHAVAIPPTSRPGTISLKHLFFCREYPPAAYPPGGIGTYVRHITRLLAEAGETVHVIAHRWNGAARASEESIGGRMIVHRVALDEPVQGETPAAARIRHAGIARGLLDSSFPSQAFSWQAGLFAERLIAAEGIDIIEAQEWEAPLYFFQLRRALGLGPDRRPPCVVHTHSPTERIFAANGWDATVADYEPAAAQEEYSIKAADAVLCPSRFIAREIVDRYGIDRSRVRVIPYPLGETARIVRNAGVWSAGTICHVGRLEPRKGVIEFAEAAIAAAAGHESVEFVFVGGDTPLDAAGGATVGSAIRRRIPRSLRDRFRFLGSRDRDGVTAALAAACASAVPSRWENFPYSCIEAMASGLPIIASPNGGMCEMVTDGVSGWIAPDATPAGLAVGLQRALRATADERARMGHAAAHAIRKLCDAQSVVERHLDLKRGLANPEATAHVHMPIGLFRARAPGERKTGSPGTPTNKTATRDEMGLIVRWHGDAARLQFCLAAICELTQAPAAVSIVCENSYRSLADATRFTVVTRDGRSAGDPELEAAQQMIADRPALTGLAILDSGVRLFPSFLSACIAAFRDDDCLGMISPWIEHSPGRQVRLPPNPAAPHFWGAGYNAPCIAVRTDALLQAAHAPAEENRPHSLRENCDRITTSGWSALAYPDVLCTAEMESREAPGARSPLRYSSMALAVRRLHTPLLQWLLECGNDERRAILGRAVASPLVTARRLAERVIRGS